MISFRQSFGFGHGFLRPAPAGLRHELFNLLTLSDQSATAELTRQGICSYFVPMPQGYRPTREALAILLSHQADQGFLVRVSCAYCSVRHYYPSDMIQLFGDIPALKLEGHMRKCYQCGSEDCLRVRYVLPSGAERARIRVRRLVELKTRKIPVWRFEDPK